MSQLVSLGLWYFLPNFVSGLVQSTLYKIFIRAGEPHPQPGTPTFVKHRRLIQTSVILLYLLYTVYEADWELQREGDYYSILGISHDEEERRIKSVARRLLAKTHPDKTKTDMADQFIAVRVASDVLSDPVKRFAYDRFGPTVLECTSCLTVKEFVTFGANRVYPSYIAAALILGALYFIGYMQSGKYWRSLAMACLLAFEVFVATRSTWPGILTHFINPVFSTLKLHRSYLPFQIIVLARKASVTAFIAHAQIMPLLMPPQQQGDEAQQLKQQLDRVQMLAQHNDQEAGRLLGLELTPFSTDEQSEKEIQQKLKDWLVHNTVRSRPEARNALGQAMQRRRQGVPHGAQGNR